MTLCQTPPVTQSQGHPSHCSAWAEIMGMASYSSQLLLLFVPFLLKRGDLYKQGHACMTSSVAVLQAYIRRDSMPVKSLLHFFISLALCSYCIILASLTVLSQHCRKQRQNVYMALE